MLMLARKLNETVIVGDDIQVKVLAFDMVNQNVILGFKAPKQISVHREEIYRLNKLMKSNYGSHLKGGK